MSTLNSMSLAMKKVLCITLLLSATLPAHAGFWDSISALFGGGSDQSEQTQTTPTTTSAEAGVEANASIESAAEVSASASSMMQTGMQLLPLLTQTLGVTGAQASGGMGALLQAAQSLLSGSDFSVLASAIPGAETLLKAAPAVAEMSSGGLGGMMNSAMTMAGEQSASIKAGSQLLGQFKSLGMGAEMIPKFSEVGSTYLEGNGNTEASALLSTAISSAL